MLFVCKRANKILEYSIFSQCIMYVFSYNAARTFVRPPTPIWFIEPWAWASERELML